jgi:uncharacterized protein YbjQ (UPF0145 family)
MHGRVLENFLMTVTTTNRGNTMKSKYAFGGLIVVVATLSGCATQVKSLPLAPVVAQSTPGARVALYFGSQEHPAVQSQLGQTTSSVRIARDANGQDASCNLALTAALEKLRAYARDRHANAVINIGTSFHSTESASATEFTCGVSPSAAALRVRGDVVVLDAQ